MSQICTTEISENTLQAEVDSSLISACLAHTEQFTATLAPDETDQSFINERSKDLLLETDLNQDILKYDIDLILELKRIQPIQNFLAVLTPDKINTFAASNTVFHPQFVENARASYTREFMDPLFEKAYAQMISILNKFYRFIPDVHNLLEANKQTPAVKTYFYKDSISTGAMIAFLNGCCVGMKHDDTKIAQSITSVAETVLPTSTTTDDSNVELHESNEINEQGLSAIINRFNSNIFKEQDTNDFIRYVVDARINARAVESCVNTYLSALPRNEFHLKFRESNKKLNTQKGRSAFTSYYSDLRSEYEKQEKELKEEREWIEMNERRKQAEEAARFIGTVTHKEMRPGIHPVTGKEVMFVKCRQELVYEHPEIMNAFLDSLPEATPSTFPIMAFTKSIEEELKRIKEGNK
jgi:hypothetical protein